MPLGEPSLRIQAEARDVAIADGLLPVEARAFVESAAMAVNGPVANAANQTALSIPLLRAFSPRSSRDCRTSSLSSRMRDQRSHLPVARMTIAGNHARGHRSARPWMTRGGVVICRNFKLRAPSAMIATSCRATAVR